jgi:DNA polymerase-4
VANLWGAGPKTAARLVALGLATIGDVASADRNWLHGKLGELGLRFHALARAEDVREVDGARAARSLSCERTLNEDVTERHEIEAHVRASADTLARRLRRHGLRARGVRVKLKRSNFTVLTRQRALLAPTDVAADLHAAGVELLGEIASNGPFRLVGLAAYDLVPMSNDDAQQLDLQMGSGRRTRDLETTLDRVAERFGAGAVQRASDLVSDRGLGLAANLDFLGDDD